MLIKYIYISVSVIVLVYLIKLGLAALELLRSIKRINPSINSIKTRSETLKKTITLITTTIKNLVNKVKSLLPIFTFIMLFRKHSNNSEEKGFSKVKSSATLAAKETLKTKLSKKKA